MLSWPTRPPKPQVRIARRFGQAGFAAVAGFALVMMLRSPSHDRVWAQEHALLPAVAFAGDTASVRNLRNFRYQRDGTVAEAVYEDRDYDLSQLTSVWYGISQISRFQGIAHTFLSFGFADGTYVAVSIEARRQVGQDYGPVRGLFRAYELIYVLADERDVIGLRSHVLGQPVRLYRVHVAPDLAAQLLRAMLAEADEINRTPRFYNTLIDNCTTGIVKYATPMPAWRRLFEYRIVLPGYSDRLVFDLDLLGEGMTLAEARQRSAIDPGGVPLDGADFSTRLRQAFVE